ncbi:DNA adenine methylase [Sphingomonas abietis]|uniref:site-specific DNA-methyltransferase (adenine-specific) n=1 Tax=Sphingomonas abietis TaxID=3012344 RepID=A0ABY7NJ10_9SPHN|nr:DNA adenine methylase [Sphingomonas abietis]WBO20975.1 DNA adenine methylase [Sphingomonas abietis]
MESLTPVQPTRPAAGYLGGKRNLARRICALIEAVPHAGYYEPFVGMGGIFLRRRSRPRAEAINDISGDVATFFRVLQEHYPYFIDMLRWRVTSRAEFQRLMALPADRLTDLQRAARFLYLQRLAFGGKVEGRSFGVDARNPGRFDVGRLEPMLAEIHERLAGVVIERLPYGDFIRRYDHAGALFYLDPPYWDSETDYGAGVFERGDFERLAEQLAGLRGRFILSINDTPGAREVFARFAIDAVETTWSLSTASAGGAKRAGELIVTSRV